MEKYQTIHEKFTNESKTFIDVTGLERHTLYLSLEEKNEILKQVLLISEENNKSFIEQIKTEEETKKQYNADNTKKRKVAKVKKVTPEQQEYFNDEIKSFEEEIKSIINMNLEEFETYITYQNNDINYYLLGLIKELVAYNNIADEAYLSKDIELFQETKSYIEDLSIKINILKQQKATLDIESNVPKKNKRRVTE